MINIQTDLMNKLQNKEIENMKDKETINQLLAINKTNSKGEIEINPNKYNKLLQLYSAEQDKCQELRNTYFSFINEYTAFIQSNNFIDMNNSNNNSLNNSDNNINNNNINNNNINNNFNNKNNNNNYNNYNIQDILNEKSKLEENENLLLTQLNALKEEIKEHKEEIQKLMTINNKYKIELENKEKLKKDKIIIPLRNALERLIYEIKLNNKIKEILNIILSLVYYSEEQILVIYQYKEKKKNFFNLFTLDED